MAVLSSESANEGMAIDDISVHRNHGSAERACAAHMRNATGAKRRDGDHWIGHFKSDEANPDSAWTYYAAIHKRQVQS